MDRIWNRAWTRFWTDGFSTESPRPCSENQVHVQSMSALHHPCPFEFVSPFCLFASVSVSNETADYYLMWSYIHRSTRTRHGRSETDTDKVKRTWTAQAQIQNLYRQSMDCPCRALIYKSSQQHFYNMWYRAYNWNN